MSEPFKILFKYPSRGRPQRFFDGLDNLIANIADVDYYHISCTLDDDDETMNNKEVIDKISTYKNTSIGWGKSMSKIDAVNRSIPDYNFDILVNMSDDMRFNLYGFDQCIRVDMNNHFPNFDGLLHYPDQDAKEWLATMYIAGRKWWEFRNKYIYHPSYLSLFCDNEEMDVARMLGKYKYLGYQINLHLNPAYGHLERDNMFNEQQWHWNIDEENYKKRKQTFFGLDETKIINKIY